MINVRTPQARRREALTQQRVSASLERTMGKAMRNTLNEMGKKAAQDYKAGGLKKAISGTVEFEAEIAKTLTTGYARAISVAAARINAQLMGKSAATYLEEKVDNGADLLTDEELGDIIKVYARHNAAVKAKQIGETTRTRIQRAVAQGVDSGFGPAKIADLIEEKTYGVINGMRAEMIARTETHAAMQYGSMEAADATGVVKTKTWVAAVDARTREDHAEMDDQTVPMDEEFTGAAEGMSFPGDPAGPAEQVINCRCVLIFNTEE
jgi:uncharacterized protein with gpF-like domain